MRLGASWGVFGRGRVCASFPFVPLFFGCAMLSGGCSILTRFFVDLLILGLGREMRPISPQTRAFINGLGIRIEVADTRNAAAQFNLLATERGVGSVAAALIPIGR